MFWLQTSFLKSKVRSMTSGCADHPVLSVHINSWNKPKIFWCSIYCWLLFEVRMVSHRFSVLTFLFSSFFGTMLLLLTHDQELRMIIHPSRKQNESFFTDDDGNPIVTIPFLGQVIGSFSASSKGRNYSAFRGIPYAKPPIKELQFKVTIKPFNALFK